MALLRIKDIRHNDSRVFVKIKVLKSILRFNYIHLTKMGDDQKLRVLPFLESSIYIIFHKLYFANLFSSA